MDFMYTETDHLAFVWHKINTGKDAEIVRVYADIPKVCIPEEIKGHKIVSVSAYCFSEINKIKNSSVTNLSAVQSGRLCEFCGDYIESIVLPDNVKKVGNNAFYNCHKLEIVEIGANLREVGSDIFMNCTSFSKLYIRCRADMPNGLKQLISRINSNIEVYFYDRDSISAMIIYPEYTDSYDEIAPAHIFGRNITGEGFRARQCFTNNILDLKQYDSIFDKASIEEGISTIYKMALGRLMYPFMLSSEAKNRYETYLKCYQKEIMEILVSDRKLSELHFMCINRYARASGIDSAVIKASSSGWGEGAASLLKWKHEFIEDAKKSRYDFG